ncbi:protein adenylyltransferase SelO-like isoform X2 [Varanus komodoensis]|uniref:protein adenylyltransferase SelO-like isoform X2 n=1 Tax=Varanus komodoensis TaxID=61221 RepID=UPI001CF76879|nr:protein adenylyltransferase SelO-like isoform X2 [Varanus komodoensis]
MMSRYCAVSWLFTGFMLVCHSACYLLDSVTAAGSFNHVHNYINKSSMDQEYCERKRKLSSFAGWRLSTEKFTATFPIDHNQDNYVHEVPDVIFSVAYPTPFKSRVLLVAVSEEVLEDLLDLDISVSGSDDFLQLVSGAKIILGSLPLAHRYGGHQFGSWAGQLGDGRAHLIGIYTNRFGDRWELQLKGSGRTVYSRNGDGRAVLHSSVREFLGSEAMHYLGIPTSRAASLVVSDDVVWRDRFYNGNIKKERGAIVLRVAKSWFRIGSLEILAHSGELDLLRLLLDFVIDEHFPSINMNNSNRYLAFFSRVVSETANLIALWMSVGFAHDFVPNTSDDERRYKIGNQANVGMFNLNKLLQALNPLLDPRQKQLASQLLEEYPEQFYKSFTELFKAKLGLLGDCEDDNYLIAFLLKLMEDTKVDFTMTFRQLSEISEGQLKDLSVPKEFWALQDLANHKDFSSWVTMYLLRLKRHSNDSDAERSRRMTGINPRYVLRNWMAESAAQKAARNDFSEVRLLQRVLQHPFQMQKVAERAGYAERPPAWAKDIKVSCSS